VVSVDGKDLRYVGMPAYEYWKSVVQLHEVAPPMRINNGGSARTQHERHRLMISRDEAMASSTRFETVKQEDLLELDNNTMYAVTYDGGKTQTALTGKRLKEHVRSVCIIALHCAHN
jgi:hypothetical protein